MNPRQLPGPLVPGDTVRVTTQYDPAEHEIVLKFTSPYGGEVRLDGNIIEISKHTHPSSLELMIEITRQLLENMQIREIQTEALERLPEGRSFVTMAGTFMEEAYG
jgi:hypothetical protein